MPAYGHIVHHLPHSICGLQGLYGSVMQKAFQPQIDCRLGMLNAVLDMAENCHQRLVHV